MSQDRLKILLIEHDAGFDRSVSQMLEQAGDLFADLRSAPDLNSGLAALAKTDFDVVLFDVCVPDGAGLANVALIRAGAPTLPIIVAGDSDDETIALEAVQAAAKPEASP